MMGSRIVLVLLLITCFIFPSFSQQKGKASYYAHRFHGRKTSNGTLYHRDSLTCAHRTLPFGTLLHVKNLKNNKTVIVKVTDRGPHVRGRIIDLSYEAALKIDLVQKGVGEVEVMEWSFQPLVPVLSFDTAKFFLPLKREPMKLLGIGKGN